jgi:hypothetical protein
MSTPGASPLVPLVLASGQRLLAMTAPKPGSAWLIHVRPTPAW